MSRASSISNHDPLRVLADALAPYLADKLRSPLPSAPEFYSQLDSPLGRRRHLVLGRRQVLLGHKEGRLVLVRRADVHAHIERRRAPAPPEADADLLNEWGLVRRSAP